MIVLAGSESAQLADLDSQEVQRLFREHGFVLCRGFRAGPAEFSAFAQRFTDSYFFGYGRAPFPEWKAITTVNETNLALEPHCDNGIRPEPQRPDITWFLCETPAAEAGETTLFDGVTIWAGLSQSTRELLSAKRIAFLTNYPEQVYTKMGCADPDSFARFIATLGGAVRKVREDRSVDIEILSSAVRRTRFGDALAFVSSLCLAGTRGFEAMRVELEGGLQIPESVMREIRAALDSSCELIRWQAGDVGMLDNTRFLHGRRGFTDMRRRLYLIQTLRANF